MSDQPSAHPLLSCEGLTGAFGLTSPLTVRFPRPALVGIIGPNGAGKTTLLRLLLGLERPVSGAVRLLGEDPRSCPPQRRPRVLSYLPQSPLSSPHWTLTELISQGLNAQVHATQTARVSQVQHTLSALDLAPLATRRVCEVSGGELRRAFVGRALIQRAAVSFLDEPLAHLDWAQREALLALIKRLSHAERRLTVITLHDLNLASLYCDELILLTPNGAPHHGSPDELISTAPLTTAYGQAPTLIQHPLCTDHKVLVPGGPSTVG